METFKSITQYDKLFIKTTNGDNKKNYCPFFALNTLNDFFSEDIKYDFSKKAHEQCLMQRKGNNFFYYLRWLF